MNKLTSVPSLHNAGDGGEEGGSVPSVPHYQTFAPGKNVSKKACYADTVNDMVKLCSLKSSRS